LRKQELAKIVILTHQSNWTWTPHGRLGSDWQCVNPGRCQTILWFKGIKKLISKIGRTSVTDQMDRALR